MVLTHHEFSLNPLRNNSQLKLISATISSTNRLNPLRNNSQLKPTKGIKIAFDGLNPLRNNSQLKHYGKQRY